MKNNLDISAEIGKFVGDSLRTLALDIDRRLVMETPFDTGAAKASWIASAGRIDNSEADVGDGISESAAEQIAINKGAIAISGAKDYETIYIQNNKPYIKRLNEGWSEQAGSGYIDKIITEEVNRG